MRNRAGVIMAGESNIGLRRSRNEDSFCCYAPANRNCALAVVADGVGGHANGALASLICCRDLSEAFRRMEEPEEDLSGAAAAFLRDRILEINRKLFLRNLVEQIARPMSSTIVSAIFMPETVVLSSAGDSRLYEFHPIDGLVARSTDHSFSSEFVRKHGFPPPEPKRGNNLIFRAVGSRSELELEMHLFKRHPESRYLLCSDGASSYIPEKELAAIMERSESARQALDQVMRSALLAGGRDNITVISVFPEKEERSHGAA